MTGSFSPSSGFQKYLKFETDERKHGKGNGLSLLVNFYVNF